MRDRNVYIYGDPKDMVDYHLVLSFVDSGYLGSAYITQFVLYFLHLTYWRLLGLQKAAKELLKDGREETKILINSNIFGV